MAGRPEAPGAQRAGVRRFPAMLTPVRDQACGLRERCAAL